jgi:hypothetical protein
MIKTNEIHNKPRRMIYIYFSLFFTTITLFIYETLLTRLFSAILSYSLVFMVVSFAILGGGTGAILTYKIVKKKENSEKALVLSTLLLPIIFLASISVMYFLPFTPTFLLYIPAALLPFVLGGVITSIIFKEKSSHSNMLYFMDLFGSGLGSLLIIKFMNSFGFLRTVILVSIFALISALAISLYYKKRQAIFISLGFIIFLCILFINNSLIEIIGKKFNAYYTSPITVIGSYKNANKKAEVIYSKWDAISKTDVLDIDNENERFIVTDGGATAPIVKFSGDLDSVQQMKSEVNYIPFSFGRNEKSLVIGSGGGKDVIFALLGGSKKIDAVEINPSTIEAVDRFKEYSGDIYNYPGVNLYNQDGRYFIENSKERYDNIYLSMVMTNSVESNMYSLAEYYIFTEEALNQYFSHLSKNGKLTFMVHDSTDLIKVLNTGIKVFMDNGIEEKEVTNYFTIINGVSEDESQVHGSEIAMPLVIFKNTPFSQDEVNKIINIASIQNRGMIHFPGNEIEPYKSLKTERMNYEQILDNINFNSKPTTDNSPFFYNTSKFIPVEMMFILTLILAVFIFIRKKFLTQNEYRKASIYFGALGIAYMLVEIPLIQKMVLYFGSSSMTFSFVIFSLLISSGLGSLVSGTKVVERITAKSPYYVLAAGIMIVLHQIGLSFILNISKDWQTNYKFLIVFITMFPMGFLMGMAFPLGIKKLGKLKGEENLVPLMMGVNGIFSVFGSTLAVVLSMKFGFSLTIYVGAIIYIILFVLNPLNVFNSDNVMQ